MPSLTREATGDSGAAALDKEATAAVVPMTPPARMMNAASLPVRKVLDDGLDTDIEDPPTDESRRIEAEDDLRKNC